MANLPAGTLTFLLTDVEGSSRLWEEQGDWMSTTLASHDALLRRAVETHGGQVFKTMGDAFFAVFSRAPEAIEAAVSAQVGLCADQADGSSLKVRMAIHSGAAEQREHDYFGPVLNRAARLLGAGHGGQILLSRATRELARESLPVDVELKDLGLHRLRDLQHPEQVYQLVHRELASDFPPLRTLSTLPNNLPQQTTSFVGRAKEKVEVKELLGKHRLITLSGPGGSGKSRLALQIAAELLDEYPDGVWLVELAPLSDGSLVAREAARVLGLGEEPAHSAIQSVCDSLRNRTTLMILDNCEHLLEASGGLASAVLRSCKGVRILATSQQALRIGGSVTFRVPPLSVPSDRDDERAADYESVHLFNQRAEAAYPSFSLTNENLANVAQIVRRLGGLPLAIELAAAWVDVLSPRQIASQLSDQFRLLSRGDVGALPRHQTLRTALEWSHSLLAPAEQELFARLSVFSGGWTLDAVEAVCAEDDSALLLLSRLVDKSQVTVEDWKEERRFHFLEPIRLYSLEKLAGREDTWRERHAAFYLNLAEQSEPELSGPDQGYWLDRIDAEHDNIRSAVQWLLSARSRGVLQLAGALGAFWLMRGHLGEGRAQLKRAMSIAPADEVSRELARALNSAGSLARAQGDQREARECYEKSLRMRQQLGDPEGAAACLANLGVLAIDQAKFEEARTYLTESLQIREGLGDSVGVGSCLNNLGNVAIHAGDLEEAERLYRRSLEIRRDFGDRRGVATCLSNLGLLSLHRRDLAAAKSLWEESLSALRDLRERALQITVLQNLGNITFEQGDYAAARQYQILGMELAIEIGDLAGAIVSIEGIAEICWHSSEPVNSARLWTVSSSLRQRLSLPRTPEEEENYQVNWRQVSCELSPGSLAVLESDAERITLGDLPGVVAGL